MIRYFILTILVVTPFATAEDSGKLKLIIVIARISDQTTLSRTTDILLVSKLYPKQHL